MSPPKRGQSISRATLKAVLEHANVRAFLMVIRHCLGTLSDEVYDLERHGAYHISYSEWFALRKRFGFHDYFDREAQDECAVAIIDGCGAALTDVLAGRFSDAIRKCHSQWTELPWSKARLLDDEYAAALAVYQKHGGTVA